MFNDFPRRRDFLLAAVERAKIDGVILVHNKFCDLHGVDNVSLRLALEKKGVPVLQLEKEYGASADIGRMKTRVQAFLERIGDRR
jgi:benzoyl-CoA reductase/2-hydroxyglutaryl-CoA dehydratase subunit BcrC/BadD/HgdB